MAKRRYMVTFKFNSKYSLKYAFAHGANKDEVYGNACALYGFMNVAGVYVASEDNIAWYKVRGFTELV